MDIKKVWEQYNEAHQVWAPALAQYNEQQEEIAKSVAAGTAVAGYQTPLVPADGSGVSSSAQFSPLVPQALDNLVGQLDFRPEHLEFLAWLPTQDVKNTIVDWACDVTNGDVWLDGALAEGELGSNDISTTKKGSCKIKSYSNRREITDVANAVALMNTPQPMVSTSQLETTTKKGMLQIHKNIEMDMLYASQVAQQFKVDGVLAQLKAANVLGAACYENLNGATVDLEYFEEKLRDMVTAPIYARPTHCFVSPKLYTKLSKDQYAINRREAKGGPVNYGFKDGQLTVEVGDVSLTISAMISLDEKGSMPPPVASAGRGKTTVTLPSLAVAAAAPDADSKFAAGDAGVYKYAILVVAPDGSYKMSNYSGAAVSGTAVAANSNLLTLTGDASYSGGYGVIFRTPKGEGLGTSADKNKFEVIARVAIPGAGNVTFTDQNLIRNKCARALILRQDPEEIVKYDLIKLLRIPLPRPGMSQPFALFTACGLQVKVPEHQMLLENIGVG